MLFRVDRLPRLRSDQGKRWMLFVDGENFTLRGEEYCRKKGIQLREGQYYLPNTYLWYTRSHAKNELGGTPYHETSTRSYYYTSVQGDAQQIDTVRDALGALGFEAKVFKKPKGKRSKGVDITLTLDVLSHAFMDNYDIAVLVAGDGDYVPLLDQIKRLGKVAYLAFFEPSGLNPELRRASDAFLDLTPTFLKDWLEHLGKLP